jgi:hypothetical protein
LNDKVDVATPGKQSVRGFMQVSGHTQSQKVGISSIIQLDYPLDIADTSSSDTG